MSNCCTFSTELKQFECKSIATSVLARDTKFSFSVALDIPRYNFLSEITTNGFLTRNEIYLKWHNQYSQSTISTESDFANDTLRSCVACNGFKCVVELFVKTPVLAGTFSPLLPLKYSFVDVSERRFKWNFKMASPFF